jgi:alpha-L-arabinofuranosidase
VLTVVNPHVSEARAAEVGIRGASLNSGTVTTLNHADIRAHNSFEQRNLVSPQTKALDVKGSTLSYSFPPASVTKLTLTLG